MIDLDIREAACLESTQSLSGCLLLRLVAQKLELSLLFCFHCGRVLAEDVDVSLSS